MVVVHTSYPLNAIFSFLKKLERDRRASLEVPSNVVPDEVNVNATKEEVTFLGSAFVDWLIEIKFISQRSVRNTTNAVKIGNALIK